MEANLIVWGTAIPQGSKSAFQNKNTGKIVVTETGGAKHKNWRKAVETAGKKWRSENGGEPFDGPLVVNLVFYMPKPASKPSWKVWCDVKPDLDKLTRSILDGLTGPENIMKNDSRVVTLNTHKQYAITDEPRVEILVAEILDEKPLEIKPATLFEELEP